jgi:hypothetical protein
MTALVVLLRLIGLMCRGHRAVALENLALRQQLVTTTDGPCDRPICLRTTKPAAATAKPHAITRVGRMRRASIGASIEPAMNATPGSSVDR